MNQRDYDGKAEEYLAECLRIEIEKKDAEIAALKKRVQYFLSSYRRFPPFSNEASPVCHHRETPASINEKTIPLEINEGRVEKQLR